MIDQHFLTGALLVALMLTLVWIAIVDIRTFTISNEANLGIALGGLLYWYLTALPLWPDGAIRLGVAVAVFAFFAFAFYIGQMGGGDVKLGTALALWFSPLQTLIFLVLMSIAGGVVTLVAILLHKRAGKPGSPETPYGVAIAFGALWLLAQRFLNHFA